MSEKEPMTIKEIELLELQEKDLRVELRAASDALRAARILLAAQEHNVQEGSIIIADGKLFRVVSVDPRDWGDRKPWLAANPQRKDGSYGTAIRNLCDWKVVRR